MTPTGAAADRLFRCACFSLSSSSIDRWRAGGGAARADDPPAMSFFITSRAAASAATWVASPERMRSASSVPRPSDAVIDCGVRISAHHHRRMRQRSTRATGSVTVHGSTRTESRSRQASKSSTARTPTSRGTRRSPRQARTSRRRGTTSSPAATPMARSPRVAMRRAVGGQAMAMAGRWWGITTARRGPGRFVEFGPPRAAARRPRCAPR